MTTSAFDLQRSSDGDRVQRKLAVLRLSGHGLNLSLFEDSNIRPLAPRWLSVVRTLGPVL